MLPVAKHGDPQLGIDIHLCIVPPGVPTPLPTPHSSIVFDPMDYVPFLGATVTCCGMKRATAGTAGSVIHIPPGFPFAPLLPESDDELFMGSATVVADGEPLSHSAHPVLGCQVAGMLSPPRKKKKNTNFRNLPTTFNLAIPTNVFVGGPPMISMMGLASKLGFAALGKFAKSSVFKKFRRGVADKLGLKKPGFLRCKVLRAEPVSILNGSVSVEQLDFSIPGRIFIQWPRSYRSDSLTSGVCGTGWETLIDTRITLHEADGTVWVISPSFGLMVFERFPIAIGAAAAELELMDGSRMADLGQEIQISAPDQLIYCFPKDRYYLDESGQHCWQIGRIMDRSGNALEFECRDGKIIAIHESAGRTLTLTYEKDHLSGVILRYAEADFEQRLVSYEYDDAGHLTTVNDALGVPYHFAYDQDRLIRHTDRNGLSFYYQYGQGSSGEWRVMHAWGDGGLYDYRFDYLDTLNERRITDSLGHVTTIKLNEEGLPISEIDPLGGMSLFEYDEAGRTTAVTDPGGMRTEYLFDSRGNLIKLVRPDGSSTEWTYNKEGYPLSVTDANKNVWRNIWSDNGLLLRHFSPLGAATHYKYDAYGQLVFFKNRNGGIYKASYDKIGLPSSIGNPMGAVNFYKFDPKGDLLQIIDSKGRRSRFEYDKKRRLKKSETPSGSTTEIFYDNEDNITEIKGHDGGLSKFEYHGQGKVSKITQSDGSTILFEYDTEERLIRLRNQNGDDYKISYNALGRVTEEIDYYGQRTAYAHDLSGYIKTKINPNGDLILYNRDENGQITEIKTSTGEKSRFIYDRCGNIIYSSNGVSTITREIDSEGNITKEIQDGFIIYNIYDKAGNRIGTKTSIGNNVGFEYDLLGNVINVRINNDIPIDIIRDTEGKITKEKISHSLSKVQKYDSSDLIIERSTKLHDIPIFSVCYEYDISGNLIRRTDDKFGVDNYIYDKIGQVVQHINSKNEINLISNNPAGERLETIINKDKRNSHLRYAAYRDFNYIFNANGNLTERSSINESLILFWDANNKLTKSIKNNAKTIYKYDALGRRIEKESENKSTKYYWNRDILTAEIHTEFTENKKCEVMEYIYYPDTFTPFALIKEDSNKKNNYFFHNDINGCPTRVTDNEGRIVWAASYAAWGQISEQHTEVLKNNLRLQGFYADEETGLLCSRHRYYDPISGLFVSIDPLRIIGNINLHQYAPNTLSWIDPLGLSCSYERPDNPFSNIIKAGSAGHKSLNIKDHQHGFTDLVEAFIGKEYKAFTIDTKGPGGHVVRTSDLYQANGSLNGIDGVFEWIIDNNVMTHRRFIPGGSVTGSPNQPVKTGQKLKRSSPTVNLLFPWEY